MNIRITNTHILGNDRNDRHTIEIEGNKIKAVYPATDPLREDFVPEETIDGSHLTAMPGLVNAHTHVYMSLFRNFADDVPFHEWLFERIMPIEDTMTAEEAYWGDMLTFAEMLRTGTTSFIDMQMEMRAVIDASRVSGIRPVLSRAIVGADRNDPVAVSRFASALDALDYAKETGSNAIHMLSAHAIYTCGDDLLRFILEEAKARNLPLHVHLTESKQEFDDCMNEHGCTPVQYLSELGYLDHDVVFAHCVYLTDEDIKLLANPHVTVATNPASNCKLANGIAKVQEMLDAGVRVALGTDGASSDNTQNMFAAMRLVTLLQKGVHCSATALPARDVLRMATTHGYEAAGLGDAAGTIELGKLAHLILIDEESPTLLPQYDMESALVYSASGYEVKHSIIDGKIVVKDGEVTTIDLERVRYETAKIADRFRTFGKDDK